MPRNWVNIYVDGAAHHLTGTVHLWQPMLMYPDITDAFYKELENKLDAWQIKLLGYVIMPEHFHLLAISEEGKNIERFLHGFRRSLSGIAKRAIESNDDKLKEYCLKYRIDPVVFYTKTAGKSEFRFWKEKPRVFPMDREKDVLRILKYIHLNPCRRGLVENPLEWEHSSYRYYEIGEPGRIKVGIKWC